MEILAAYHPEVVHFPVAILILYAVLEITAIIINKEFIFKAAHLLLAIGVVSAVAAVLTGNQAADVAEQLHEAGVNIPHDLIEQHEEYATITLWFFTGLLFLRTYLVLKKKFQGGLKYLFIPLVLVGLFFIYRTGNYGGKLVYDHGVGTKLIPPANDNPLQFNSDE